MNVAEYANNLSAGMQHDEMLHTYNLSKKELYNKLIAFGIERNIAEYRVYGDDLTGNGWTDLELDYLKSNYSTKTNAELADALGKTSGQIAYRARAMGLQKCNSQIRTVWNKGRIDFLIKNHSKMSYKDLAKKLNVATSTVFLKCRQLGLKKWR